MIISIKFHHIATVVKNIEKSTNFYNNAYNIGSLGSIFIRGEDGLILSRTKNG
tara:strand:- start:763 stop:921 length:159 start_codon:yes stop_codon:yes gene_type:complete